MEVSSKAERAIGRVAGLWRYPVKSMLGERLRETDVGTFGFENDRRFALRDVGSGAFLSAKRVPELLGFQARISRDGLLGIEFPSGFLAAFGRQDLDARLSHALGRQVELVERTEGEPATITNEPHDSEFAELLGASGKNESGRDVFQSPLAFFDQSHLHLLTTGDLAAAVELYPDGAWDVRRFRPNIVIDTGEATGFVSEGWIGRGLRIGNDLIVSVTKGCTRCVMTTHAQEGLERDRNIQKTLIQANGNVLGVRAQVVIAGTIREGDPAVLLG